MARSRRTLRAATSIRFAAHLKGAAQRAFVVALVLIEVVRANDAGQLSPPVRFEQIPGAVAIRIDDDAFATYVYRDDDIPRPYFCNVRTPSGRLVTRPRPPGPQDLDDHPQMHPGIWFALGDLNGSDNWRLKAPVKHVEFVEPTEVDARRASFAVRNRYYGNGGGRVLGEEVCRYTIRASEAYTVLEWDSTFSPGAEPLVFGDQEEMGLGVRMASIIAENQNHGGRLTDSSGRMTASSIWGQPADWCDYSGVVDGRPVGITVAGHPDNVRKPWWHARDYGFMAANPFGRAAMKQGEPSRIEVKPGESLRLRFAIIVHDGRPGDGYDAAAANPWREAAP